MNWLTGKQVENGAYMEASRQKERVRAGVNGKKEVSQ